MAFIDILNLPTSTFLPFFFLSTNFLLPSFLLLLNFPLAKVQYKVFECAIKMVFDSLAPHQLDLLQHIFGVITRAHGYPANCAHLYEAEDTISACFYFESGIPGSGSWCFVGHESAKEDRIELIGDKGSLSFSVFDYDPILLVNSEGRRSIVVPNPSYVQLPIIKSVIEDLQGIGTCECTCISATPTNWVLDRILWKN